MQLRELRIYAERRGWTIAEEYVDAGVSGAKDRRPALDRLMKDARQRRIDVIVVWALDRYARSLRHLVTTVDELGALGVGFVAYSQGIDTSAASPAGTLTLQILGAVAQFERALIISRCARASPRRVPTGSASVDRRPRSTRSRCSRSARPGSPCATSRPGSAPGRTWSRASWPRLAPRPETLPCP